MSQFSFPVLENDELLPCLEEMEVHMDASQLAKPSYEIVRAVMEQITIMLTGVSREELTQPVFTAMDAFEYPELHDESIPCNNFFQQLSKLMLASGVKDFSWRDIFKPEPPRLRRNLSAIVNFAKFREDKALAFQELQAQLDALVESAKQTEEEYAHNTAEMRRLQAARAEQAQAVAAVEAEEADLTAANTQLNKTAAALQNEVRALKASTNAAADAASAAKLELSAARQETDILQDQIVQSPDKQRQAIAELAAAADAKRMYVAQLQSLSIDHDRKLEMIAKFEKELARCVKLMEELDQCVARKKDVSQQVKDVRDEIGGAERALGEVTNTGATLKRHQATLQDKLARVEHQAGLRLEAAASHVEEALKSKEAVAAENAAAAARAAEDEAMIRSLREKAQEVAAAHEATVRGVMDKYQLLRKAVSDYNQKLEAAMDEAEAMDGPVPMDI